jgi:hypothetical protein
MCSYWLQLQLFLENYNVYAGGQKSYLSAGDAQLPTIYGLFTMIYCILFVIWLVGFMRGTEYVDVDRVA